MAICIWKLEDRRCRVGTLWVKQHGVEHLRVCFFGFFCFVFVDDGYVAVYVCMYVCMYV